MRRIRVFHLIKSLNRGGAETLLAEGQRFADGARFEFAYGYFNPHLNALAPTLAAGGASVTCFAADNFAAMLAQTPRIARHLRDLRVDILHCHLPTAGVVGRLAGRLAGVPVVYTEHNKPEWYRRPTFWTNALTYGLQQHVVAVSGSVEESIRTYIKPRVPVTVVRNGIDVAAFRRVEGAGAAVRQRFGIPADAPVVGNVAALIPQKRLHDWIEAACLIRARHANARFLLVGEGPVEAELVPRIAACGLDRVVHLCGVQADVRPFLAAMDVYMMSSAYEGLPVALLEAMAMGCAPVCTAVGGIPEVMHDRRSGFLTQAGHPEQLAARVGELLDDPTALRAMAAAARQAVEGEFDIARMMRQLDALYLDVLGRAHPGASGPAYPPPRASGSATSVM